ncbi:hypothetical protein ACTXT7_014831 [Hymenolepis weldensis]
MSLWSTWPSNRLEVATSMPISIRPLVLQNIDELFQREELSAAPDTSWPDIFNSGVFVYRPSLETFHKLSLLAKTKGSFDGGDQFHRPASSCSITDLIRYGFEFLISLCTGDVRVRQVRGLEINAHWFIPSDVNERLHCSIPVTKRTSSRDAVSLFFGSVPPPTSTTCISNNVQELLCDFLN